MLNGIDVSKHNGTVDWPKVKAADKDFAMIRLGWAGYDGRIAANGGLDPMFEANAKGAIAAGLDIGLYVFFYCKTAAAAKVAALETLQIVKDLGLELTYPIAIDIEDNDSVKYTGMSNAENTAIVRAFLTEIEAAGYYGIIYASRSFLENNLDDLSEYDKWVAQWNTQCSYGGFYGMWQHHGDAVKNSAGTVTHPAGTCSGVSGACDLNTAYMDYPAIIRAAGLNGFSGDNSDDIVSDLEEEEVKCNHEEELAFYRNTLEKIRELVEAAL